MEKRLRLCAPSSALLKSCPIVFSDWSWLWVLERRRLILMHICQQEGMGGWLVGCSPFLVVVCLVAYPSCSLACSADTVWSVGKSVERHNISIVCISSPNSKPSGNENGDYCFNHHLQRDRELSVQKRDKLSLHLKRGGSVHSSVQESSLCAMELKQARRKLE